MTAQLHEDQLNLLPYVHGSYVREVADHLRKLANAHDHIAARMARDEKVHNFSGLERGFPIDAGEDVLDDELSPALYGEELKRVSLEHLGGRPENHATMLCNRVSAAMAASFISLVSPGDTVMGVSTNYSHPCVKRAAALRDAPFIDTTGSGAFSAALESLPVPPRMVVITRLSVAYEMLPLSDILDVIERAREIGALVVLDEAGGARVAPAVYGQPRSLELAPDLAVTGLDKYGTSGPRLGLVGGEAKTVDAVRATAFAYGLEARPLFHGAVLRSLQGYSDDRVRELVATTKTLGAPLREAIGDLVHETDTTLQIRGEALLERLATTLGTKPGLVPIEATALLAMLLLQRFGILTVHFAGLPPGTSSLLFKFVPPKTLAEFGGPTFFAHAVGQCVEELESVIRDEGEILKLLYGDKA